MPRPRARTACILLLPFALVSCGDEPLPPAPGPARAGTQATVEHTPRVRADAPPALPRPGAALIEGDLGGWTPAPEDAAMAARLGDPDPEAAKRADDEFRDLPEDRRIAILRAGIRLADATAARRAAMRCQAAILDAWEQTRASSLFIDGLLDPAFTDTDGEDRPLATDLYEVGGSSADLSVLLRRFAEHPVDPALLGPMGSGLHKLFRQGHGTEIAALLAACDEETADEAWSTVAYGLASAAVADADAVAALRARVGDRAPAGIPDPAADPLGAAVAAMTHRDLVWMKNVGDEWLVGWATRLVDRAEPASLVARAADVRAAIAAAAGRPGFVDRLVARVARAATPESAALVRELVDLDRQGANAARVVTLARIGDAEARAAVTEGLFEDGGEMLAEALVGVPEIAHPAIEQVVRGSDDDAAEDALEDLESALDEYIAHRFDRAWFVSLGESSLRAGVSSERLARITRTVRPARTASVARALLDRESFAAAPSLLDGESDEVLAFLEIADADALRQRLREAWDAGKTEAVTPLLRLGDARCASRLVHHVQTLDVRARNEGIALQLARTHAPEVRTYLIELAADEDPRTAVEGTAALAAFAGLPEATARGMLDVLRSNDVTAEELTRIRAAAADGRPADALAAALAACPGARFADVALAGDRPEVVAYLRRLQTDRTCGLYAWATAELAAIGYAVPRDETFRAIADRRYRWTDELTWRQWMSWVKFLDGALSPPDEYVAGDGFHVIAEIAGENCCSRVHVSGFFDDAFGLDVSRGGPDPRVSGRDRALHAVPDGSRWRWSRIVGHLVRVPE